MRLNCLLGRLPERGLVGWWCDAEAFELVEAREAGCQLGAVLEGKTHGLAGSCCLRLRVGLLALAGCLKNGILSNAHGFPLHS